jgi:hypothetical protein
LDYHPVTMGRGTGAESTAGKPQKKRPSEEGLGATGPSS